MPIYEYQCRGCGERFEHFERGDEKPACPACGGHQLEKQISVPAAPQIGGGGGTCSLPRGNRPCAPGSGCGGCPCAMGH